MAVGSLMVASAHRSGEPEIARKVGKRLLDEGYCDRPSTIALLSMCRIATVLVPVVAIAFMRARPVVLRVAMAAQTLTILVGFFAPSYPILLRLREGNDVELPSAAAPSAVLEQLALTVTIGLALILPALTYLIRVHKTPGDQRGGRHLE